MLIDATGRIVNDRVHVKIFPQIEKGLLKVVHGILVHQTDSSSAASTFASYKAGAAGAHFLIDKDGTIIQTARLIRQTWHVGKLKSRCLAETTCSPSELKTLNALSNKYSRLHKHEAAKAYPRRYPSNLDSIGIELVGKFIVNQGYYESVTDEQNASLNWLVRELQRSLNIMPGEVFRHPTVSWKQPTEAATAVWK